MIDGSGWPRDGSRRPGPAQTASSRDACPTEGLLGQGPNLLCRCQTVAGPAGGTTVVVMFDGEIDISNVSLVEATFWEAFAAGADNVVVDLAGVRFCSVRGCTRISEAWEYAEEHGVGFAVACLSEHLQRIAAIVWGPAQPACRHPTVAAAVADLASATGATGRD